MTRFNVQVFEGDKLIGFYRTVSNDERLRLRREYPAPRYRVISKAAE